MINFTKILFTIELLTFLSYLISVTTKYGILNSISESYYRIKNKWCFTFFIWGISVPIIMLGVEKNSMFFFAGALLAFVGASPAFKNKDIESIVHIIGATGGIALANLALFLCGCYYISIILLTFIFYATYSDMKNSTWWIEIASFISVNIGLIILNQ